MAMEKIGLGQPKDDGAEKKVAVEKPDIEVLEKTKGIKNGELVVENLSVIRGIARSMKEKLPTHIDLDDLVSAGILRVLEIAPSYDPSKGTSFAGYIRPTRLGNQRLAKKEK
jgi:RNA polymerase sigma factor for flagellar operon FliA